MKPKTPEEMAKAGIGVPKPNPADAEPMHPIEPAEGGEETVEESLRHHEQVESKK
ncbi:MAG: hypothetical protein ACK5AZ_03260 [Bryobacteraceae bacterium]